MESSIFKFVLKYSLREQVLLLVLTIASFPFFYLLLYLPKLIVNEAIDADASAFPVEVLGLELGAGRVPAGAVRDVPRARPRQRRLQVLPQRLPRGRGRAHAPAPALRPLRAHASLPAPAVSPDLAGRARLHHRRGDRSSRRLHRRFDRTARVPGWDARHPADLHVRRGPGPRPRRHRAVSAADVAHPEAAAKAQREEEGANPARPRALRTHRRGGERDPRDPYPRHLPARAREYTERVGEIYRVGS